MNNDQECDYKESIAEDGDNVVNDGDGSGLVLGLVVIDEVNAHLEVVTPIEDVEHCGYNEGRYAQQNPCSFEFCLHYKKKIIEK